MARFDAKEVDRQAVNQALPGNSAGVIASAENAVIEGLRGFAALMVLASHYAGLFVSGTQAFKLATTGVDLFFVLSGFVFAPYVLGRPLPLLPHLVRRFFRLYPLYLLALVCYALAKNAWLYFPVHLFMLHTFKSVKIGFYYNPAFWSLPPEVEFYLVLPLIAGFGSVRTLALLLPAAILGREWLIVTASGSMADPGWREISMIHLPGLFSEFMLGALVHVLVARYKRATAHALLFFCGLALLAVLAVVFAGGGDGGGAPAYVRGNIGLMAACGYALLAAALTGLDARLGPRLRAALLSSGHLSYGVYLFHNLSPMLLRRAVPDFDGPVLGLAAFALTLALAFAAHRAVERPLRDFGRRLSRRISA